MIVQKVLDSFSSELPPAIKELNNVKNAHWFFCVNWTDLFNVLLMGKLSCRLDSLIGLFAAGCQPSSTNDPFGLRRISYGLVS